MINKGTRMKRGSTTLLKGVIYLVGLAGLAVCTILIPELAREEAAGHPPDNPPLQWPFLLGAYITAVPFFIALYQALKLLTNIDKNKMFTEASVKTLRIIKYCGGAIASMIVLGALSVIAISRSSGDDPAGFIMLCLIFTLASTSVAAAAAVLQQLFQNAIDIKSENDATV